MRRSLLKLIIATHGRDRFGESHYNDEAYARQYDK